MKVHSKLHLSWTSRTLVSWARHSQCVQWEKEHLVTLDRFSWMLLECLIATPCNQIAEILIIDLPSILVVISTFETRTRVDLQATFPWESKVNGTKNTTANH